MRRLKGTTLRSIERRQSRFHLPECLHVPGTNEADRWQLRTQKPSWF